MERRGAAGEGRGAAGERRGAAGEGRGAAGEGRGAAGERRGAAGESSSESVAGFAVAEFEEIYARFWPRVFAFAFVLTRHTADAEDSAAEGFRRAYGAWTSGRRPGSDPLPWLLLITRRVVQDERRRRLLIRWLPLPGPAEPELGGVDPAIARSETWLWFEDLCRFVPERQREALLLRYQFDMDDRSIGEVLGVSQLAVRKLVSRGLAVVREHAEGR